MIYWKIWGKPLNENTHASIKVKQIKQNAESQRIPPSFKDHCDRRTGMWRRHFLWTSCSQGQSFPQLEVITGLLFSFFPVFFFFFSRGRIEGGNRVKTTAFGHGIYVRVFCICVCTCLWVFIMIFDSGTPSRGSWGWKLLRRHNLQAIMVCVCVVEWKEVSVQKRPRERMRIG